MSASESFVVRWSRLKRETAEEKPAEAAREGEQPPRPGADTAAQTGKPVADLGKAPEPEFDVSSLPSIESIAAGTDIRAFLQAGVPAELTRAALRRAWAADPAIRDFIGLAENQWDFTDPSAIPGFGPLEATDDLRRLVAQAMEKAGDIAEPRPSSGTLTPQPSPTEQASVGAHVPSPAHKVPQAAGMPEGNADQVAASSLVHPQDEPVSAALHHDDKREEERAQYSRRTHGRALPK
jgi:Protein of unknown function (DUF3306)